MNSETEIEGIVGNWLLGEVAKNRVVRLADRFRALLLLEVNRAFEAAYPAYIPWMAAASRRVELRSAFKMRLPDSPPELLIDQGVLLQLKSAFAHAGEHPLQAIVPQDIGARLDVEFGAQPSHFVSLLEQAKHLIFLNCPWIYELLCQLITYVVPIIHRPMDAPVKRGFSTPLCYGAIFLTFEDRSISSEQGAIELAIDLAHEVGHHVLHTYQTADPILRSDLRAPVYSGVKQIERPAIMSVHASVALAFMIAMSSELAKNPMLGSTAQAFAEARCATMKAQQRAALIAIRALVAPTELGERILTEMERQLAH